MSVNHWSLILLILLGWHHFVRAEGMQQTMFAVDQKSIDARLIHLDETKISDIENFKDDLTHLSAMKDQLTEQQQEFVEYFEAYQYVIDGDLNEAQKQLKQLFERLEDLSIKIRVKATLANIQAISREYETALYNLDFVIKNVDLVEDSILKSKVNLVAAVVYNAFEIFEMSAEYADLVLNADVNDVYTCKSSVIKLRAALKLSNDYTEDDMHKTIELCKKHGQQEYAQLLILGWLHNQIKQFHASNDVEEIVYILNILKKTSNEIDRTQSKNLIGLKDMLLAKAYAYTHQYDLAIEYANKAIEGSHKSGNTKQLLEALIVIKDDAIRRQNFQQAYDLMQQINQSEREVFNESKAKQMAYMTVMHSNLAKQLEIQNLRQNNQVLALENKLVEESSTKQQLIMLLVLSLLMFLVVWTYKIKRKHDYFKEVAEIDHLTQVFTRKAFEEHMRSLIKACEASGEPLNLAIMDLDHFKGVNDIHGHLVGDWVLKQAVLACEEVADENIMMARLGGEEFAIVSPKINAFKMMTLMHKMRESIAQMDCVDSGAEIKLTASFGVSNSDLSGYSYSMLLTHADLALFEAKNSGRNKVVEYTASMEKSAAPKA